MKRENGYTLVEVMVSIVITSVIVVFLGLAVHQIIVVPERGNDQVQALHDVQYTAHWLGIDIPASKTAVGGTSLTLTLGNDTVVQYICSAGTLYRYAGGSYMILGQDITSLSFSVSDETVTTNIVATPDGRWDISENQTYRIAMRL